MNGIKNYLKMSPVILYPYAYLIWIVLFIGMMAIAERVDDTFKLDIAVEMCILSMLAIAIVYQILALAIAIQSSRKMVKDNVSVKDAAKMNLITKCAQIPAYIFHFIVGFFSLMLSVWGIGFLLFVCVVDVLTILLSGIFSIGCMINMKKAGVIPKESMIIGIIGSFIYCVDVGIAIWMFIKAQRANMTGNWIM